MANADMFLKLEGKSTGPVKGESADEKHPGEIAITEWSWGMQGSQGLGGASGVATARTAMSEIRFGKRTDSATTQLMSVLRNNEIIKQAVLTVRKAGTHGPVEYLIVTLKNGRLTSHTIGTPAPNDPVLAETFSMAFEEIEVKYTPQVNTGDKSASMIFNARVHAA